MSYGLFDTHAHYTDDRFETEYEGGAEALLRAVFASGVEKIVNVGTNYENSLAVIEQAAKHEGMYAAVGIHPGDCKSCEDIDFEIARLSALLERREELKIVAIGEIGFDYYWEPGCGSCRRWHVRYLYPHHRKNRDRYRDTVCGSFTLR